MQQLILILILLMISTPHAIAENCKGMLTTLSNARMNPEKRSEAAYCLLKYQLSQNEVAKTAIRILKDPSEDLLLKEDIISGFASANLRKKIIVDQSLSPEMGDQDENAVQAVDAGNTNALLALTKAVKTMSETVVVTRYEGDFLKAISDIAIDESNHIMLRTEAVNALEKISFNLKQSGLFDEKYSALINDTIKNIALSGEPNNYYSGAMLAYSHLNPNDAEEMLANQSNQASSGRSISSISNPKK